MPRGHKEAKDPSDPPILAVQHTGCISYSKARHNDKETAATSPKSSLP